SSTGGHVRLFKPVDESGSDQVIDLVGWGNADSAEGAASVMAPANSQSLKRRFSEDGVIIDTDNNAADFVVSNQPNPQSTPPVQNDQVDNQPSDPPSDPPATPPPVYLPINITEMLPDPVAPATDANDEFIELFNPNSTAVDLAGYVLKTGSS